MKKQLLSMPTGIVFLICIFATSCSKSEPVDISGKFTGNLKLDVGLYYRIDIYAATRASASDLKVDIFEQGGVTPVKSYENYSEVPEIITLTEGNYYVAAYSKENPGAAFEKPYYYGESGTFQIRDGETTSVSVKCTLSNIMVTIAYSERVQTLFTDYTTTVSNDDDSLTFLKGEKRAGFLNTGPLTLRSQLTYDEAGESKTKTLTGTLNAQKGEHYAVNVDTYPGESSAGTGIVVGIDENIETIAVNLTDGGTSIPGGGTGELLITEIMYHPDALTDTDGEWIEIFNNSESVINMKNYVYKRGNVATVYKVTEDILVQPGNYVVFGRRASATDNVAYVTTWVNLVNTGTNLIIANLDGEVICSVDYGAVGFNISLNGASLQLDPSVRDIEAARLGSNWCAATVAYSTGDLGTPGAANTPCQ